MDNLRWILLLSGILLIIGIFVWEVFRRRHPDWDEGDNSTSGDFETDGDGLFAEPEKGANAQPRDAAAAARPNPTNDSARARENSVTSETPASTGVTAPAQQKAVGGDPLGSGDAAGESSQADESLICAIAVTGKPGHRFSGGRLCEALEAVGLRYGPMGIFHYYGTSERPYRQPVFSAANMLEPGSFDLETIDSLYTPGIMLFMQLPGEMDGTEAFDLMLATGKELAERLGGELRDETRSSLTPQSIGHMRERIIDFGRKRLLSLH